MKEFYYLDPSITFLNHGSFGACPKPVFETYQNWQLELEQQPVEFMTRKVYDHLEKSRFVLGDYVGCHGDDLIFETNPTTAVNTIIRSLDLGPGDEVLMTDMEYGSLVRTWEHYGNENGYSIVKRSTPTPLTTHEDYVEHFWESVTEDTKVIYLSEITSSTGLILPAMAICKKAKEAGIITFIDGAHVPAHIPLNITEMDPDIYVGACHKWLSAPKGSSFLYVKKSLQEKIKPLIISWGSVIDPAPTAFIYENQCQGTWDPSAFLTVPASIQFQQDHDWDAVRARCRKLNRETRNRIYDIIDTEPICPNTEEWLGQMASIIINIENGLDFKWRLMDEYKLEMPVFPWGDKILFRISFNAYNDEKDADRLIEVLCDVY
ncbi:MAG: aminotransferase class V-fold PLP-dependent enzyme [Candidatus Marinimicrobia bacterium]|jgi:isopenicillin-N epimerase|nr:aminotransferase class V-fold PLP-dependent enzyme [Candidatus Neomarinimicrobiota bacterium]MBT4636285.1 aminotransferase class V-fold PLP-dependent enzyme [Candidatus Neomarinimicrobiota bacterium]MBT4684321.1 aminotransferase class V-fold PLP-dependent enzyme [Candidatus Neomarinimicrobiota bacterium]MBT5068931.1 aminotransferase class V-fold PLP-dependent enzyme [Candidatus Neomarinimicrobiota bacterium]MBT6113239.1 aminotransferase class V-fold PLP-dependent enzyme [Candidatus Neomarini